MCMKWNSNCSPKGCTKRPLPDSFQIIVTWQTRSEVVCGCHYRSCCRAHMARWKQFRYFCFVKLVEKYVENRKMETQFKHSIKVPNQYKKAAKVLKNSMQSGASVKGQIFAEKHAVNKQNPPLRSNIYIYSSSSSSSFFYWNTFFFHCSENQSSLCVDYKNFHK